MWWSDGLFLIFNSTSLWSNFPLRWQDGNLEEKNQLSSFHIHVLFVYYLAFMMCKWGPMSTLKMNILFFCNYNFASKIKWNWGQFWIWSNKFNTVKTLTMDRVSVEITTLSPEVHWHLNLTDIQRSASSSRHVQVGTHMWSTKI